jgi:hypothetical protein
MKKIFVYIFFGALVFLIGCATAQYLKTEGTNVEDITGTYDLILYGSRQSDDIETVAILKFSGGPYKFEPYAPAFDFRVVKNVPGKEAFEVAKKFVSWHPSFLRSQLSRILDPENRTIGYELRPLYFPIVYGIPDVLDVDYWLKPEGMVTVKIKLKPEIERKFFGGSGSQWGGGK